MGAAYTQHAGGGGGGNMLCLWEISMETRGRNKCNVIILSGLITAAYMCMWRVARVLYCDKCPLLLCFRCVVSDGH